MARKLVSILFIAATVLAHASYDVRYTFRPLTSFPGYPYAPQLKGMGANGWLLAYQPGDLFGPLPGLPYRQDAAGSTSLAGNGIPVAGNLGGVIVGSSNGRPCQWTSSGMQLINAPIAYEGGYAVAITNNGWIAGQLGRRNPSNGAWIVEAFAWTPTGAPAFIGGLPDSAYGESKDVNSTGTVVGRTYYSSIDDRGWRWEGGTVTPLPTIQDAYYTIPEDINDDGLIVGWIGDSSTTRPAVWSGGTYQLLPQSNGQVFGVNNAGVMVGRSNLLGPNRATLWRDGEAFDLGSLIDNPSGAGIGSATRINDRGQILIGNGILEPHPVFEGTLMIQGYEGSLPDLETTLKIFDEAGRMLAQIRAGLSHLGSFAEHLAVPSGSVRAVLKAPGFLASAVSVEATTDGASGLEFVLRGGDIDDDNEVAIGDYAQLSMAFNATMGDPNWKSSADFNGDQYIDIFDFAVLSAHYGDVGDE